jgi:hypothetical protein
MRRIATVPILSMALAIVSALSWSGTAQASASHLTYQVSDARAYAFKASVPPPVIQAAPKCDPKADKFHCQSYYQRPNCPKKVAIGPKGEPPDPRPPDNADGYSGSAGQGEGNDPSGTGVPQSSAVRVNQLIADGSIGREGNVVSSNGFATIQYTDLGTPPWNGNEDGYTETDAFTNQANYQERCSPNPGQKSVQSGNYAHQWDHSYMGPATSGDIQCFGNQCKFCATYVCEADPTGLFYAATATHAESQTHLWQSGEVVNGLLSTVVQNLTFPGGQLEIDQLQTYVSFQSDGTADGLRWKVISTAQGVHLGGQPINLPPGQSLEIGGGDQSAAIGMAGPYVKADKDGSALTVVAPGFFVATSQQTQFYAGAEVQANFGQSESVSFPPLPSGKSAPPPSSTGTSNPNPRSGGFTPPSGGTNVAPPSTGGTNTPQPSAQPQFALLSKHDPPWAPVTILAIGFLGFLMVFLKWSQQFEWGRRMYEVQPIRGFQWLYRAFLKT